MIGNQTPTYDAAGEMLSDGTGTGSTQYTWNAEGRMATVTPNGGAPTTYVYDGDGHRVEDTAAQTLFWYGADGTLLGMTDPAGPGDVEWIYFAGRRISKFVMGYAGPWGAAFYDDANGSLLLETDGYGNTNCRANYYPFGDPVGSGCQPYENIQFAGLYSDATGEDGGDSATHRRYSATYYRWFSPDPAGMAVTNPSNPQTWNMYSYADDNPTTFNDPSGMFISSDSPDPLALLWYRDWYERHVRRLLARLINAQNTAMRNPEWQPPPTGGHGPTWCNYGTCSVARQTGAPLGPFLGPDGRVLPSDLVVANLAEPDSGYREVSARDAQRLANQGKFVVAAWDHHVSSIRPAGVPGDRPFGVGAHVPWVANVGWRNGVTGINWAFPTRVVQAGEVHFYTPELSRGREKR